MAGSSPPPNNDDATNEEKARESCRVQRFLGFQNKKGFNLDIFLFFDGHLFLWILHPPLHQLGSKPNEIEFLSTVHQPC